MNIKVPEMSKTESLKSCRFSGGQKTNNSKDPYRDTQAGDFKTHTQNLKRKQLLQLLQKNNNVCVWNTNCVFIYIRHVLFFETLNKIRYVNNFRKDVCAKDCVLYSHTDFKKNPILVY